PELEAPSSVFLAVLDEVEPAKAALTGVMPTTRMPGRSLPDALLEFEERLTRARDEMPSWRSAPLEDAWIACDAGLAEALDRARRLREEAPDLGGFEGLIWAVERLLGPLEPFADAAARFRSLGAR
ncbi:MAG: hypothetical protein ACXVQ0_12450, partial [Actinomycetota bacterium]